MKPRITLVTIGHVDHGKSTLLGRLLVEKGVIAPETVAQYERQAALLGKASFKYAWVLDRTDEARTRGLTLDLNYADFATRNRKVHLIDAPGHQDFVRSMITGTTGADAALLVVDASEGPMPQTREHAQLAGAMGLRQVVVVLNKIDKLAYDAGRVASAAAEMRSFLEPFRFERIDVIPVSAWEGENLTRRTSVMQWYRGRTLEEAIDALAARPSTVEGSLRLPIMDVLSVGGVGTVAIGRVERGTIRSGEEVAIEPAGKVAVVKSIEVHGQSVEEASAGDTIGVALRNVGQSDIARGDVVGPVDPDAPVAVDAFEARLAISGDVGHVAPGWSPRLHCHAASIRVRLAEIISRIDPATGIASPAEGGAASLAKGDAAVVRFVPEEPVVVEGSDAGPALSRFALRTGRATVGAGSVTAVTPHVKAAADRPAPASLGFSYKHQKAGSAARRKREKDAAENRDIHGRPIDRRRP
ncbi:MAG: GTP-binding protein [Thermoplasmatota archaeon]